jgi:hypothetical protein
MDALAADEPRRNELGGALRRRAAERFSVGPAKARLSAWLERPA